MTKVVFVLVVALALPMAVFSAVSDLVINEVMSNPDSDRADPYGFYDSVLQRIIPSDWIEIYNPGAQAVPLAGLYLSDNCAAPDRWEIPLEAELTVPAGGTLVIWCPGYYRGFFNCAVNPGDFRPCPVLIPVHMAPIRLSSFGEWIGLYAKDGQDFVLIDGFAVPPMPLDQSFGCLPDGDTGSRGQLSVPTIGTAIGDLPPGTDRMSGALNSTGHDNRLVGRPPVVEVRWYRAVKGDGECAELSLLVEPGDAVRVRAGILPDFGVDSGIAEVLLYWKLTSEDSLQQIPMSLEFSGPHEQVYEAAIGGQADGDVVEFFIYARNDDGLESWAYQNEATQEGFTYPVGARGNAVAGLVINEVLAANASCPEDDPAGKQNPVQPACGTGGRDRGEDVNRLQADGWIELYNTGNKSLDLADLYLTNDVLYPTKSALAEADGHHLSLDADGRLPGQTPMLIWCDNEVWQNDHVGYHAPFDLDPAEDEVFLIAYRDSDQDGDPEVFVILDVIAWGPREKRNHEPHYHLDSQDPDWSLGRYPDGAGETVGRSEDWGRMAPTPGDTPFFPGGANTDWVPYLELLGHEPVNPVALDADHPITFSVRSWDDKPLPAGAVTLSYASLKDPVVMNEVTMRDDGMGADAVAGDTIYTGVINDPPMIGKIVYCATALDSDGNLIRSPYLASVYRWIFAGELTDEHLIISEVVAANRDCRCGAEREGVPQPQGCDLAGMDNFAEAESWIELMNPTDQAISLGEYWLSNRLDWRTRWTFPVWAQRPVLPGERIVVWCDQALYQDSEEDGAIHTDFLLDPSGDAVILVRGAQMLQIVDYVAFSAQVPDMAYGRDGVTGEWGMVLEPTLGRENARLAANATWITELGDPLDRQDLRAGCCITVTGTALDQTARVVIVDPMPCEPEDVRNWDWAGLRTVPVEPAWLHQGEELAVVLPRNLADGPHLLCVLSGADADAETWYEGGVPFTRIPFSSGPGGVCEQCGATPIFVRGDPNQDGRTNLADSIYVLHSMFADGPPILCRDAADTNDDEKMDIADAIYIMQYLFADGPPIPQPFPDCGFDTTGSRIDGTGPQLIGCADYCPEACQDPPVPCR